MPIVRRNSNEIDDEKLRAEFAAYPQPSQEEIERHAAEDGDAWTDEDFANARVVYPPPTPERVRALRERLGMTQSQFAWRFSFDQEALEDYELGRQTPSGSAATLLKVLEADPEAVIRAMERAPA